jgi:hypothetical protein
VSRKIWQPWSSSSSTSTGFLPRFERLHFDGGKGHKDRETERQKDRETERQGGKKRKRAQSCLTNNFDRIEIRQRDGGGGVKGRGCGSAVPLVSAEEDDGGLEGCAHATAAAVHTKKFFLSVLRDCWWDTQKIRIKIRFFLLSSPWNCRNRKNTYRRIGRRVFFE